jgi:hypothetical protein
VLTTRTQRTLSVRDRAFSPEKLQRIARLALDPGYEDLLDIMEMACIEQETALINTPVEQMDRVLGEHCLAKAAWQFFTYIQKQVQNAYTQRTATDAYDAEEPSEEEHLQSVF